jgi:hypothetical protein
LGVEPVLNQDIKHNAVLIDGTPGLQTAAYRHSAARFPRTGDLDLAEPG